MRYKMNLNELSMDEAVAEGGVCLAAVLGAGTPSAADACEAEGRAVL